MRQRPMPKFRLINAPPTLMAVLILAGAMVMAWNQAVALGSNVTKASAIFLDALMVANIFGTLRSAQMKAIFQMAGQGLISIITVVFLWKIGAQMGTAGYLYQALLIGTSLAGVQLILTLTGKNADIDDGIFDEKTRWNFGNSRQAGRQERQERQREYATADSAADWQ